MKKYYMYAEAMPKKNYSWFPSFSEGNFIGEFKSQEDAQDYLNTKCEKYGTNEDEHYDDFGPIAKSEKS